jgi:hypothetical protein
MSDLTFKPSDVRIIVWDELEPDEWALIDTSVVRERIEEFLKMHDLQFRGLRDGDVTTFRGKFVPKRGLPTQEGDTV